MLVISGGEGTALLDTWLTWAWHGPRPPYATLARSIRDHRARIDVTIEINDLKHLEKVITSLRGVEGVLDVERTAR